MEFEQVARPCDRLVEAMAEKDLKAVDLAKMTGISTAVISRYRTGERVPRSNYLLKLAVALGVRELWLWGCDVPKYRDHDPKMCERMAWAESQIERRPELLDAVEKLISLPASEFGVVATLIDALCKK